MDKPDFSAMIEHAVFCVAVNHPEKLIGHIKKHEAIVHIKGCEDCILTALTMAMVGNPKFRRLINLAGAAANKIRRGEMDAPDFHHN